MKETCEVMFINLPMSREMMEKTGRSELIAENLGLAYLTAILRESGARVKIVDAIAEGWSTAEILTQVLDAKPRLVGLPIFQSTRKEVIAFTGQLKENLPGTTVICGGQLARQAARDLLTREGVDLLCTGEGEEIIGEVLAALYHQDYHQIQGIAWKDGEAIQVNPPAPFIMDLEALPWPVRDTLAAVLNRGGVARIVTSRGCPRRCAFCSVHRFMDSSLVARWRARPVVEVMEEIAFLRANYGVGMIAFNEDNFFGAGAAGYARAEELARSLMRKGWGIKFAIACRADDVALDRFRLLKEAGLIAIEVGIESGAQSALNRWSKGIPVDRNYEALRIADQLGLVTNPGFIMFDAHTTLDELQENRAFIRRCSAFKEIFYKFEQRLAHRLIPYAGTPIRERYRRESLLHADDLRSDAYDDYSFCDPRVQEIYRTMELWETITAPLRRLCWEMGRDGNSAESSRASRRLLEELMELSMQVLEETLLSSKAYQESSPQKATIPWPPHLSAALITLTKSAVASLPA